MTRLPIALGLAWAVSLSTFPLGCTPARRPLGELLVKPLHELYPSLNVVHDVAFRVESGRLVASGANAGTRLDLVVHDDGCLRGEANGAQLQVCPASEEPGDPKGLYRFRSVGTGLFTFSTRLLDLGDRLRIEFQSTNVELNLPPGPTGDELRQHPELLGTAFVFGLFPASSESRELWTYQASTR